MENTEFNPAESVGFSNKRSQADNIVSLVEDEMMIDFFLDQKEDLYASIYINSKTRFEIIRCNTTDFKSKIAKWYWDKYSKTPQSGAVRDALAVMHGKAVHEGDKHNLENRLCWDGSQIVYDLVNPDWEIVEINAERWRVNINARPLFRREAHNKPQVRPEEGGDIYRFLDFVNIANKKDELLLLVYLVSCFIPGFPHPIAYFYGPQGSAKSTMSKLLRALIDPSHIDVSQIPDGERELDQLFEHHWFIGFDNVSFLNEKLSDTLCKAVTGVSSSKRKLYTDDEYVIYSYQRCIAINGINLLALKPDLLERSILFELERVQKTKRQYEQDFWKSFEAEKPKLLGAIFSIISKAMRIKETVVLNERPRMADFALWGYAIAEAMDRQGEAFICAYNENINKQTMEVLYEHPTAFAVLAFMEDKDTWTGTASALLSELRFESNEDSRHQKLPETANALSRSLAQIRQTLEEGGIKFSREDGKVRSITLENINRKTIENIENIAEQLTINHDN